MAIEYLMRMREDNRNNFMCIVDLVDAAKMKIDRYKMNKTLDAEVSYFSDATFRALMDIVYDEMRRVWLREKRKQEFGNFDCRKYVQIAKRFRRYMTELGFIDNKSRTVSRKTQKINGSKLKTPKFCKVFWWILVNHFHYSEDIYKCYG